MLFNGIIIDLPLIGIRCFVKSQVCIFASGIAGTREKDAMM